MAGANGVGSGVDGIGRVGISLWVMGFRRPEAVMAQVKRADRCPCYACDIQSVQGTRR